MAEAEKQQQEQNIEVSTHSRPKAAGISGHKDLRILLFQHTAARRRLGMPIEPKFPISKVSTHSSPKAAGATVPMRPTQSEVSTHSSPKAAGEDAVVGVSQGWFQHTAARRRLE